MFTCFIVDVNIINLSGKLTWKMKNNKVSVLYIFNDAEYLNANRIFMFAPDGAARSYPRSHLGTFQWNQMLTSSAFYELKFSYLVSIRLYYNQLKIIKLSTRKFLTFLEFFLIFENQKILIKLGLGAYYEIF